ncbi:MAG TPA: M15 family metallopeptidase, partial [Rectinemataceae bacterium]|nr:M15 family metallopeptidase [Rectinemataceae bacterium]
VLLCLILPPILSSQASLTVAVRAALAASAIPPVDRQAIEARIAARPARFDSLLRAALADDAADPMLLALVDKKVLLPESYVPPDLMPLDDSGIAVTYAGHKLRAAARRALLVMAKAARKDGIELVVGSAYRSYAYQKQVFAREVQLYGEEQAERESAHPGASQHQLGLALDFSPIDDVFAETKASRWLSLHARAYGFSLSYPKGGEAVTGYRWESWHYRFIGIAAAALEGEFFGGMQQYLIEFLEAYRGDRKQ